MPYKRTGRPPGRPRKKPVLPEHGESGGLKKPPLSEKQWAALWAEVYGKPKPQRQVEDDEILAAMGNETPSPSSIARHAGVTRKTIWQWRNDPLYQAGRRWLIIEELGRRINARDKERKRVAVGDYAPQSKRSQDAGLEVFIRKNWPEGSVVSKLDGKHYDDPMEYLRHIIDDPDAMWHGNADKAPSLSGRKSDPEKSDK